MKIAVRYCTKTGNTKKLAEAVGKAVNVPALDVSEALSEKIDILFLGSSVYAAGVDESVKSFIKNNAENIGVIVNFSTAALLSSTYNQIKKLAAASGVDVAPEEFHCRGSFKFMHRGRPDADDMKKAAEFALDAVKKLEK